MMGLSQNSIAGLLYKIILWDYIMGLCYEIISQNYRNYILEICYGIILRNQQAGGRSGGREDGQAGRRAGGRTARRPGPGAAVRLAGQSGRRPGRGGG